MCAFTMFHPRWILASNLSIVPFSLELSGIRLICASSLRFTEGFCMESIKYEQRQILIFWIFIYQNVNKGGRQKKTVFLRSGRKGLTPPPLPLRSGCRDFFKIS